MPIDPAEKSGQPQSLIRGVIEDSLPQAKRNFSFHYYWETIFSVWCSEAYGRMSRIVASAPCPTCPFAVSQRQQRPMSRLLRPDVLVNAEKIVRIVLPFNFRQSIIVVAVGRFDPVDSFIHHEVYVRAS